MCHQIRILCALLGLVLSFSLQAMADESINLRVGETHVFPAEPGDRVVVGNSKVVGYQVKPDAVYISGRRSGFSSVEIGDTRYSVNIFEAGDLDEIQQAAADILRDVEGVQTRLVAGRLLLTGQVLSEADLTRCDAVAAAFGMVSAVTLDTSYHYPVPMVHLAFHFAEVNREMMQKIGINWNQGVFTTVLHGVSIANGINMLVNSSRGARSISPIGGVDGQKVLPAAEDGLLSLNEDLNHIRVHEVHETVVMSGQEDDYLYGGTLLIKVATSQSTGIEKVDYGVSIKTRPVVDKAGNVRLELTYDISDIAESTASNDYRLNRRRQSTTVLIQEGDTLAIGGVLRLLEGKGNAGLPRLSRIPFLGMLFGSQAFQEGKTDGVIFVTPTLVRDGMPHQNQRIRDVVDKLGPLPPLPRSNG